MCRAGTESGASERERESYRIPGNAVQKAIDCGVDVKTFGIY